MYSYGNYAFNYTVVTYGYLSLQELDKDHCAQNKLVILMMHVQAALKM